MTTASVPGRSASAWTAGAAGATLAATREQAQPTGQATRTSVSGRRPLDLAPSCDCSAASDRRRCGRRCRTECAPGTLGCAPMRQAAGERRTVAAGASARERTLEVVDGHGSIWVREAHGGRSWRRWGCGAPWSRRGRTDRRPARMPRYAESSRGPPPSRGRRAAAPGTQPSSGSQVATRVFGVDRSRLGGDWATVVCTARPSPLDLGRGFTSITCRRSASTTWRR